MNICSFKETKIVSYVFIFLDNVLLGPTQGDIHLNPESQKFRLYGKEKGKK